MIDKNIKDSFDTVAANYDKAAFLQHEIAKKLIAKTIFIKDAPQSILDLGAGSGILSELLVAQYPDSKITAIDNSEKMCEVAAAKPGFKTICADARQMPFSDWAYRAIYSNLMLQWVPDYLRVFTETKRVLAPGGFFIFSTFGPKTLVELRRAWAEVDDYKHVNDFAPMQEIADKLSQQGFIDVVVSTETIVVKYDSIRKIFADLKAVGATNVMAVDKYQGLMTRSKLAKFYKAYEAMKLEDGSYPVSYEVIYAICWSKDKAAEVKQNHVVSVDHLRNLMQKFNESSGS
jgi:malonyl-CoA O-methyltransferase